MISVEEARAMVQSPDGFPISLIQDLGDKWAFEFYSGDPPIPGVSTTTVNKETGELGWITIPPLENIDLLNNAPVIWESEAHKKMRIEIEKLEKEPE